MSAQSSHGVNSHARIDERVASASERGNLWRDFPEGSVLDLIAGRRAHILGTSWRDSAARISNDYNTSVFAHISKLTSDR